MPTTELHATSSDLQRFSSKYMADDVDDCLVWVASKNWKGYGQFWFRGAMRSAHRCSYEMFVGPIPEGLVVDHLCRVRSCVNPSHLRAITATDNTMAEGSHSFSKINAEATHCAHGHAFDDANTYFRKNGGRQCRACRMPAQRRYRDRKRSARWVVDARSLETAEWYRHG